ncbi:Nif3-like dinuclear metal center hexameric protein [Clostridium luticellarii]|nr:Nif3-like dinuclear metal center hexameric protein [Clostridium luticellarii]MCI1944090.1 Nif3-like dinuclear metal center hexameric protein [Clostridium luticellarii]MCI1967268.1 Nif3-like dinuclear metal center hexameric protein [Clostridium luticellarii]MCI1995179.1 Nif3-like dinuclear metal center hexameric protein [Clostridium luticellarii]MCI2039325.1 Nif3-like dinuclear metal center hexameric protein [Clostridium luticellarii]
MYLKIMDIHNIVEKYAPSILKESYDNVGLMVGDMECRVTSILVALDCTLKVIEEAKQNNCNLIFTHHPLLFKRPDSITSDNLLGEKIIKLIESHINVYSCHTNLDSAEGGINDIIVELLGLNSDDIVDPIKTESRPGCKDGIGRISQLEEPIILSELCNRVKKYLEMSSLRYVGNEFKLIKKVAVINGSGQSYFNKARLQGVDCIITGDTTYHYVSDFEEQGMAVIDAGHFGTEWPAMEKVAVFLQKQIKSLGFENSVVLSKINRDPYKYK